MVDKPIRKLHRTGPNTYTATIASSLVEKLNLDAETYVEQEIVDEGILLRIRRLAA